MASNSVSMMSRRHSSVFNQSGFLTSGSILEQRRAGFELDSIQRPPLVPCNCAKQVCRPLPTQGEKRPGDDATDTLDLTIIEGELLSV